MFDWLFNPKYELPSKELIDEKTNRVKSEELSKKNQDCKIMYNLLNKTLQKAVSSNNNSNTYYYTDIDTTKLNSKRNMNVSNCDNFENYKKQLDERGIKYVYYENCRYKNIRYDLDNKVLTIHGS